MKPAPALTVPAILNAFGLARGAWVGVVALAAAFVSGASAEVGTRAIDRDCCAVFELRQHALRPGQRDVLIELFDREFVETQEAVGIRIHGQFRDADDPDRLRVDSRLHRYASAAARTRCVIRWPCVEGPRQTGRGNHDRCQRSVIASSRQSTWRFRRSSRDASIGRLHRTVVACDRHDLYPARRRSARISEVLSQRASTGVARRRHCAPRCLRNRAFAEQLSCVGDPRRRGCIRLVCFLRQRCSAQDECRSIGTFAPLGACGGRVDHLPRVAAAAVALATDGGARYCAESAGHRISGMDGINVAWNRVRGNPVPGCAKSASRSIPPAYRAAPP